MNDLAPTRKTFRVFGGVLPLDHLRGGRAQSHGGGQHREQRQALLDLLTHLRRDVEGGKLHASSAIICEQLVAALRVKRLPPCRTLRFIHVARFRQRFHDVVAGGPDIAASDGNISKLRRLADVLQHLADLRRQDLVVVTDHALATGAQIVSFKK